MSITFLLVHFPSAPAFFDAISPLTIFYHKDSAKIRGVKYLKQSEESLRAFFDEMASQVGVKKLEDWYSVKLSHNPHLNQLIGKKKFNLFSLLAKAYPEHVWMPWMFSHVPKDLWDDIGTQRIFFEWAIRQLAPEYASFEKSVPLETWYRFSSSDVKKLPGSKMIEIRYEASLITALQTAFPNHGWQVHRFKSVSSGFWDSTQNRRSMIQDYIESTLKLDPNDREAYYNLSLAGLTKAGASFLVTAYNNSVPACVLDLFPELNLEPWKFKSVYETWWDVEANQRRFMLEYALPQLARLQTQKLNEESYSSPMEQDKSKRDPADEIVVPYSSPFVSDASSIVPLLELLYTVKDQDLVALGGKPLLNRYKSVASVAHRVFPAFPWQRSKFAHTSRSNPKHVCVRFTVAFRPNLT
jgi:hypothetical protein